MLAAPVFVDYDRVLLTLVSISLIPGASNFSHGTVCVGCVAL